MGNELDDFNRRMTNGNTPLSTPPSNAAESLAQSFIDARLPHPVSVGGGSIDFGIRPSAVLLLAGIALFTGGSYALDHLREGAALGAIAVLLISGFLILIGGGGLVIGCIKNLGHTRGRRAVLVAIIGGLIAWWLSARSLFIATLLPSSLAGIAITALILLVLARRDG